MPTETDLMVLEVPILEDDTVATLYDFLLDLMTQVENHYGHQLRRQWQKLDAETRDPLKPWQRLTTARAPRPMPMMPRSMMSSTATSVLTDPPYWVIGIHMSSVNVPSRSSFAALAIGEKSTADIRGGTQDPRPAA